MNMQQDLGQLIALSREQFSLLQNGMMEGPD